MKLPARRHLFGLAGALGVALTFVMLTAAPAAAHAELVTTEPKSGGTIPNSPQRIQLTFTEDVEVSLGSIELFDERGDRVDIGAPHHADRSDRTIEADTPELDDGGYVVTWRAISADSHPVHGAFTFAVGRSSADTQALAAELEAEQDANRTVGVVFAITRAAEYAGIALLVGATVFAAAIRPSGRRRSRADALVWIGWVVLFVSTIFAVMLQGPYASALPFSRAWDVDVVREVLRTRYGHYAEVRIVLLLLALPLLLMVRKTWRPPTWWWAPIGVLGLGIAATPGLAGHAANGMWTWLAMPLDTLHVTAMAIWLGGLAALAVVVLDRDPDARRAAERFSPVALTSVIVIVITGVFASWRQVGLTREAFVDTTFGRILLAKVAVFLALIALAAWSRRIVRARRPVALSAAVATESAAEPAPDAAPTDTDVRHLRWSVLGEVVFGIAVLVLTSMLVNTPPARSELALPFATEMRAPNMLIDVTVDPAEAGPVVIHVFTLTPSGANQYIVDATATMSLPSKGIAPIEVPLERAGPSHFQNLNFVVPFAGDWQLVVRAYKTQVDEAAAETTVPIG
jgi:copper transport protein